MLVIHTLPLIGTDEILVKTKLAVPDNGLPVHGLTVVPLFGGPLFDPWAALIHL